MLSAQFKLRNCHHCNIGQVLFMLHLLSRIYLEEMKTYRMTYFLVLGLEAESFRFEAGRLIATRLAAVYCGRNTL